MLNFISQTLYSLKRDYGTPLELYTLTESAVDLETGVKSVSKLAYVIQRAILLPKRILRDFTYDLSFVAANKNFTYGGLFDKGTRTVIIDSKDYPTTYVVNPGDYAVMSNARYNVKEAQQFDHRKAVVLILEEVQGEQSSAIFSKKAQSELTLSQVTVGVL